MAGIDVHSYGELILRNWGYTMAACPDEEKFGAIGQQIALNMNRMFGSNYESMRSSELYPAMGALDDWFYASQRVMGMTFEMRDKGGYGFLLPARFITVVGQELLEGILTLGEKL